MSVVADSLSAMSVIVTYGPQLFQEIQRLRREDPLAPITIVCPDGARDDVVYALGTAPHPGDGGARGIAGVQVLTTGMYLAHIAQRFLPRTPLTKIQVAARIRSYFEQTPAAAPGTAPAGEEQVGSLIKAKGLHTELSTRQALLNTVWELLSLPTHYRNQPDERPLPRECRAIAEYVRTTTLKQSFSLGEVLEQAAQPAADTTVVVWQGYLGPSPAQRYLAQSLTGQEAGAALAAGAPEPTPGTTSLTSYADEDDELLGVARQVRALIAQGTDPAQIAVVSYRPEVAQRLRRLHLTDVLWAPEKATVGEDPQMAALRSLLEVDPQAPRPRLLHAALVASPKYGRLARAMDTLTRSRNKRAWLQLVRDAQPAATPEATGTPTQRVVAWLAAALDQLSALDSAATWEEWARSCTQLATDVLGLEQSSNPSVARLINRLEEIQGLGGLMGAPSRATGVELLDTFFEELAARRPGPAGAVQVTGPAGAVGRQVEHLFVVGATNDVLPPIVREDPAINLLTRGLDPQDPARPDYLLFKALSGCAQEVHYSYPRTSIASGVYYRSPWVPANRDGEPEVVTVRESRGLGATWRTDFRGEDAPIPASAGELAALESLTHRCGRPMQEIVKARRKGDFTSENKVFNGFISADLRRVVEHKQWSASAVENLFKSPQSWFIERILNAYLLDKQVDELDVSASEQGSFIHAAFERWTTRTWEEPDPRPLSAGDVDWDQAKETMRAVVEELQRGFRIPEMTEAQWNHYVQQVLDRCLEWVDEQHQQALAGWRPVASEFAFGGAGSDTAADTAAAPATLTLSNGWNLQFSGFIDRIDVNTELEPGTAVVRVKDFKTGRAKYYKPEEAKNDRPVWHCQLPLYRLAVEQALAGGRLDLHLPEGTPIRFSGVYDFVLEKDPADRLVELPTDIDAFRLELDRLFSYVERGQFPPGDLSYGRTQDWRAYLLDPTLYASALAAAQNAGVYPLTLKEESND